MRERECAREVTWLKDYWFVLVKRDVNFSSYGISCVIVPPEGVGWGGGGGDTPTYELYRYVPHFRVWFSSRFSLK